jgi:hypothetical protein
MTPSCVDFGFRVALDDTVSKPPRFLKSICC